MFSSKPARPPELTLSARLLRAGSNAVFRLKPPVIVRVSRPEADAGQVCRVRASTMRSARSGRKTQPNGLNATEVREWAEA